MYVCNEHAICIVVIGQRQHCLVLITDLLLIGNQLRNLEYLSLNNNLLQTLPDEIGLLSNLRRLTLSANPRMSAIPLALLRILKNLELVRIDVPGIVPRSIVAFGGRYMLHCLRVILVHPSVAISLSVFLQCC